MAKLSNTELHSCFVMPLVVVAFLGMLTFATVVPNAVAFKERVDACIAGDNGPGNWEKGYRDAQRDFQGLNGHGYDDSTHLKGKQADIYVSGYKAGWEDAKNGVTQPSC